MARPDSGDEDPSLLPPRPFFLSESRSSHESTDAGSDSDRDSSPTNSHSHSHSPSQTRTRPAKHRAHIGRRHSQLGRPPPDHAESWSESNHRSPPSAYPFQAYPGNPDPLPIPSRRSSLDSLRYIPRTPNVDLVVQPRPRLPTDYASNPASLSQSNLYRSSAGTQDFSHTIPRTSSATTFRTPFLSPASRPSSLWSPPQYPGHPTSSPSASSSALPLPAGTLAKKPPAPSTRLTEKLTIEDKPWLASSSAFANNTSPTEKDPRKTRRCCSAVTITRFITLFGLLFGIAGAAILCYRGYADVETLSNSQLCLVLDDEFDSLDLQNTWSRVVMMGGFGNGEFEMTTDSDSNSYAQNGELYILPTLTSNSVQGGLAAVLNGATYTLDGCTGTEASTTTGGTTSGGNGTTTGGNSTTSGGNSTTTASGTTGNTTDGTNTTTTTGTGTGTGTGAANFIFLDTNTTTSNTTISNSTTSSSNSTSSNSTATGGTTAGSTTGASLNPCSATSSSSSLTPLPPVMSARLSTRGKKSIRYGKVEVRAKIPTGDWLWPAIWMMPEGNGQGGDGQWNEGVGVYGAWPVSGEIDIMESRGNSPSYPAQGSNYVRSSMNYGPFPGSQPVSVSTGGGVGSGSVMATLMRSLYGWVGQKRGDFSDGFHVYAMEWTDEWMRFYVDSQLQAMMNIKLTSPPSTPNPSGMQDSYFFRSAGFPAVAVNASSGDEVVVPDPWAFGGTGNTSGNGNGTVQGSNSAPFDQQFYMILDLAVGGTSGWFPDGVGGKMWYDASASAMYDFAKAQDQWSATWPQNADDLAFRVDYVKMWELCG